MFIKSRISISLQFILLSSSELSKIASFLLYHHHHQPFIKTTKLSSTHSPQNEKKKRARYDLGIRTDTNSYDYVKYLSMPEPVNKTRIVLPEAFNDEIENMSKQTSKATANIKYELGIGKNQAKKMGTSTPLSKNDIEQQILYNKDGYLYNPNANINIIDTDNKQQQKEEVIVLTYDQIDASIPPSVYSPSDNIDLVWDLMKQETLTEANREPLLVSFLHSSILNHDSLESALAFHLANRLSSPHMLSTQIMSLILESLECDEEFGRSVRADILAVRDRDPACTCLPDVFLYFKGFHALQSYRVANYFYRNGRKVLAHYLQSQVSQSLQIDIHPNATLGRGIMLDHGTGIVIGETAVVGDNCSILHHVTLGGSGRRGVDRHPKIGEGVLIGAGSSVLGNIKVGTGAQIGAGTLVIMDLPSHCVAVGVPARIVGTYAEEVLPSINMNQDVGTDEFKSRMLTFEMENI